MQKGAIISSVFHTVVIAAITFATEKSGIIICESCCTLVPLSLQARHVNGAYILSVHRWTGRQHMAASFDLTTGVCCCISMVIAMMKL